MVPLFGALSSIFGERGLVGSVVDILKGTGVLKDPETELKVQQALFQYDQAIRSTEANIIQSINQTMQAESRSEHWAQWLWRPVIGFVCGAILVNNYIFLPYLAPLGVVAVEVPSEVWAVILTVLGVAAGTRGAEKVVREWHNGKKP